MSVRFHGFVNKPAPYQLLSNFSKLCARQWSTKAAPKWQSRASKATAESESQPSYGADGVVNGLSDATNLSLPSTAYGRVMSSQANYYRVKLNGTADTDKEVPQVELLCKARSLMHKMGRYVLVGDNVTVINIDWQDNRGLVSDVQPRTSEIMNPKVANVDHFALVFALADPPPEAFQITRFLVSAESVGIPCSILLNKTDLVTPEVIAAQIARIKTWGYTAVPVSVESGQGMEELSKQLENRCTVLAGPSGVGKSSIINKLREVAFDTNQTRRLEEFAHQMATEYDWHYVDDDTDGSTSEGDEDDAEPASTSESPPVASHTGGSGTSTSGGSAGSHQPPAVPVTGVGSTKSPSWMKRNADIYGAQAVGNVGHRSRRGRHTTRCSLLLDMPGGGLLADTPGFNYPNLAQVSQANIMSHFPEITAIQARQKCGFANCTHLHEPDCAVKSEPWERYEFYVRMRQEVVERQHVEDTKLQMQKRRRQGQTKVAKGKGGTDVEVARLDTKKHRRTTRGDRKLTVKGMLANMSSDDFL